MKIKLFLLAICLLLTTSCDAKNEDMPKNNKKEKVENTTKEENKKKNVESFSMKGFEGKLIKSKKVDKDVFFGKLKEVKLFEVKCNKEAISIFNSVPEKPSFDIKENEPFYMAEFSFDSEDPEKRKEITSFLLINVVKLKDKNDKEVEKSPVLLANVESEPSFYGKDEDHKIRFISNTKLEDLETLKLIDDNSQEIMAIIDLNK